MSKSLHNERISKVIKHLENNLENEIDMRQLSSISCYSEFHFHRVFRACIGESVYSYKKRLLLERAVKQLLYSNVTITHIAFESGYENQSSFNKAFRQQFSVTPSQVRKKKVFKLVTNQKLNPIRRMSMIPKIKTIEPINVICSRQTGSYAQAAPKAWETIMKFAYSRRLMSKNVRSIGVSHDDPTVTSPEHIRYDACLDLDTDITAAENVEKAVISGGKYAIFLHEGPYEGFQQSYEYIFNHWLPQSGEVLRDKKVCFENYLNRDPRRTKPENLRTEIYIPLN